MKNIFSTLLFIYICTIHKRYKGEQQSTQADMSEINGGSTNTNLFIEQTKQNQHLGTEVQSNPHQVGPWNQK